MMRDREYALDELELIESLGLHIPEKSREAIITAIMSDAYEVTVDCVRIEISDMSPADIDTIAEEQDEDLKPVFGL